MTKTERKQLDAHKRRLKKLTACQWIARLALIKDSYVRHRVSKIVWWDYIANDNLGTRCGAKLFVSLFPTGGIVSHFTEEKELYDALHVVGYPEHECKKRSKTPRVPNRAAIQRERRARVAV